MSDRRDTEAILGSASPRNPERRDALEVVERGNLAGRMARQGQADLLRPDPGAVVAHANQPASAPLELHFDALRAGVEGILDQLLDHGGRPLDDLTGRDLVDEFVGKNLN